MCRCSAKACTGLVILCAYSFFQIRAESRRQKPSQRRWSTGIAALVRCTIECSCMLLNTLALQRSRSLRTENMPRAARAHSVSECLAQACAQAGQAAGQAGRLNMQVAIFVAFVSDYAQCATLNNCYCGRLNGLKPAQFDCRKS